MDADQYLDRIGLRPDRRSRDGLEGLAELQRRHLRAVPFTNAFVDAGAGTSPDPETAVPRIISGGGGLCYDCNGAFAWLLAELGYDVRLVSARPRRDDGSYGPEYDHLALLVAEHLVDVGFGDFARQPLPLDGAHRTDVSGTYRVIEDGSDRATDDADDLDDGHTMVAQRRADDGWEVMYRFDTLPRTGDEFAELADFHATSPDSPFAGDRLATIPTANGRISLSGTSLTVTEGGTKRKEAVPPERVDTVLRDRFGLVVPDR